MWIGAILIVQPAGGAVISDLAAKKEIGCLQDEKVNETSIWFRFNLEDI